MNNLPSKFRFRIFVLMAIFLVSVLSAFAQTDTIAIIDAGSSGTRLLVYKFDKHSKEVDCIEAKGTGPALSTIIGADQDGVNNFLDAIINQSNINPATKKKLHVLATAGMRKGTQPPSIYGLMLNFTNNKYEVKSAMTISGRFEGLYAWIAANYEELKNSTPHQHVNTKGIIEIGGASMQITFAERNSVETDNHVDMGGLNIYSRSYLNGGADSIFKYNTPVANYSRTISELPTSINFGDTIYGLGRPIQGVVSGMRGNGTVDKYISALNDQDSFDNYHPKSNANYVKWLTEQLDIRIDEIIPKSDVSWTKGAAYDISINDRDPEPFDYMSPN